ncbi:MAG: hypothetical protein GWO02_03295, partial [Gammaproteobacteria bacterium]|nr:hypothetical protein [Gammaproteobacteria bacterium]
GGFDVALAPHRSFRSGLFVALSRAPLRVGYRGAQGQWAYRQRVDYDRTRHAVERYLALLEPLGIRPHEADREPRLDVDPSARATVESWLSEHGGAA